MNPLNLFDDFDLDIVKIANAKGGPRSCDNPDDGSGGSIIATVSCPLQSCFCPEPTEVTECPSACAACSDTPICQSLEGRC